MSFMHSDLTHRLAHGASLGAFEPTPMRFTPSPAAEASPPPLPNKVALEKPKRPCSAYNYFFKDERKRLLDSLPEPPSTPQVGGSRKKKKSKKKAHGKCGFQEMAVIISKRWKETDDLARAPYYQRANEDKIRYYQAVSAYRTAMQNEPPTKQDYLQKANDFSYLDADIPALAQSLGKDLTSLVVNLFS